MPNRKWDCHNLTGPAIADNLRTMVTDYVDHDAVDATKLEGSFDFELEWTPRAALAAKGADGISLFDALEKQLGLKLELRNIPMPALAVERVNRKPTPNPDGIAAKLNLTSARFEAASVKPANPDGQAFRGIPLCRQSDTRGWNVTDADCPGVAGNAQCGFGCGNRAAQIGGLTVLGHSRKNAFKR